MTKIDIFSGFLGAGKTTLIKKLIAEAYAGEKLVLIENEFGEINIDGGFLKESGIEISEMSAGCICCSLVGDFNKALREVVEQFHPDRILIEPSGVGKLSDVIVAVERTVDECPELKLNSYVTVADASKVKVYMKNFGEFYNNQIEAAGTIILSRTQKLSQEKLEAAAALLPLYAEDPLPTSLRAAGYGADGQGAVLTPPILREDYTQLRHFLRLALRWATERYASYHVWAVLPLDLEHPEACDDLCAQYLSAGLTLRGMRPMAGADQMLIFSAHGLVKWRDPLRRCHLADPALPRVLERGYAAADFGWGKNGLELVLRPV